MKYLIICLLLTILSCNKDNERSSEAIAMTEATVPEMQPATENSDIRTVTTEPYELKLEMNKLENDVYDLVITMNLFDDAHFVSPNAKRDFKGKFTVLIDDTSKLKTLDGLVETPRSVEEFDPHPFTNGLVNWVRVDTRYNQKFQRTVESDFQITGTIQFTIEPRCTLEKIPFIIKYEAGNMRVEILRC